MRIWGRSAAVGAIIGAMEGVLYVTAEGIAIFHLFAALLLPLPLSVILTRWFRVPRAGWAALLGTCALAALTPAMIALAPGHSIAGWPRALYALPPLVAGVAAYAIAGYAVNRVTWWWPVLCAALGVGAFVTTVLLGHPWIVNWHEERALSAVDVPLLGLPGQAPSWVEIVRDPGETFVLLEFGSSTVALHPVSLSSPQAACVKPYPGEPPYTCRQSAGGQWIREHGLGGVVVFGVRHGVLVEVNGESPHQAATDLDSLTPATAASLAWSR
ncbi:hypothetical protein [Nonomuraea typhae]|uniref:Uncharacterized protein n=1 Tax=Nonomuraea typhae TaxID=2603600 RepID=A0ABW7Z8L3_9ACTN